MPLARHYLAGVTIWALVSTNILSAFSTGDRIRSNGDIYVRTAPPELTRVGTGDHDQDAGVHGTIVSGPINGTAGGYAGNWWEVDWDAGIDGWCAESMIVAVPTTGDVSEPSFSAPHYTSDNLFWQNGFAPALTSPPNPKLGSALGNCTWYAHGRLRQLGYNLAQANVFLENASQWDTNARENGIPVDTTPTVGSIAQTDVSAGDLGHVAVVEAVHGDGTITVTESSYSPSTSSTWNFLWRHRTVSASWFQKFIHVSSIPSRITDLTFNGALVSAEDDGSVRIRGARIASDSTDFDDYVVLTYKLGIPSLQLTPVTAQVYPDIGVVYRWESLFMKDVSPTFSFTRGTQTFNSGQSYSISANNEQPFHMNLEAGMSLSFNLTNPSKNYHLILMDAADGTIIRDSYFLQGSSWTAWRTPIFRSGEYLLYLQAEDSRTMTLTMKIINENRFPLQILSDGSTFSTSFLAGASDYAKYKLALIKGQTLVVTRTGGSSDVTAYLIYQDSTLHDETGGGNVSTVITRDGDYYYVIRKQDSVSGSFSGRISVSAPSMSYTAWRNMHVFDPGSEYPDNDPDGDGLLNFFEYSVDSDPNAPTSPDEFQSLSIESGNAMFSVAKPKFATEAAHQILSGEQVFNLNNRAIQLIEHPLEPSKEVISVSDPISRSQYYQLRIIKSMP